mgnify:CR=1 FL=1
MNIIVWLMTWLTVVFAIDYFTPLNMNQAAWGILLGSLTYRMIRGFTDWVAPMKKPKTKLSRSQLESRYFAGQVELEAKKIHNEILKDQMVKNILMLTQLQGSVEVCQIIVDEYDNGSESCDWSVIDEACEKARTVLKGVGK